MDEKTLLDGRYLLHERLGGGMFGSVFRAEQRALGITVRQVAVKLFDPTKVGRAVGMDELLVEALRLMALVEMCDDPVIRDKFVTCFDAGLEPGVAGRPYVVMELVSGDLSHRIDGKPLPVLTAIEYTRQICRAVAFMHRNDHLHRDLKPANVLLTRWDSVKIGDFGLATPTTELLRRAATVGDLAYQPPEALTFHQLDPSADVYAIGLVCYEMLTGGLPHALETRDAIAAKDQDRLIKIKSRPVPPLREMNIELKDHSAFEQVVLRAMAPLRSARYRDGDALLADLEAAVGGTICSLPPDPIALIGVQVQEAKELLRRGQLDRALELASEAKAANDQLPPGRRVAEAYPVLADALMSVGEHGVALEAAKEGLHWRYCRATLRANAIAFRANRDLSRMYAKQAEEAKE